MQILSALHAAQLATLHTKQGLSPSELAFTGHGTQVLFYSPTPEEQLKQLLASGPLHVRQLESQFSH